VPPARFDRAKPVKFGEDLELIAPAGGSVLHKSCSGFEPGGPEVGPDQWDPVQLDKVYLRMEGEDAVFQLGSDK